MLCCPHCSQFSTIFNNIVESESSVTILNNVVDNYEQCGQDFMRSVYEIQPSSVAFYSRAGRFPVLENIRNEKFPVNMQIL